MAFPIHLFPLGCFVLTMLTWITTYLNAVLHGHVGPDFPYISHTGAQPPESCIFSQCLNLSSALAGITIYIRHMQIREHYNNKLHLRKINQLSLFFGIMSAVGMSMVANFQETTSSVKIVHLIGAGMAFGLGLLYAWLQTYISYRLHPIETGIVMCHLRAAIAFFMTAAFVLLIVFAALAHCKFHGDRSIHKWRPRDGGFVEHSVATISEWIMGIGILLYMVTFAWEFEQRALTHPQLYKRIVVLPRSTSAPDDVMVRTTIEEAAQVL